MPLSLINSHRSIHTIHYSWSEESISPVSEMLALWQPKPLAQKRLKPQAGDGT